MNIKCRDLAGHILRFIRKELTGEADRPHGRRVLNAISVLNQALEADPRAMQVMMNFRVRCNDRLANHSTIQVWGEPEDVNYLGLMGLINGLFGVNEHGAGHIAMLVDADCNRIERFQLIQPEQIDG